MQETDFLVIGTGIAGLRAAIELAPAGRVLVLAKSELTESATQYAQGGIAVALSDEDEISLHLHDTIAAGDGLVNEAAAQWSLAATALAVKYALAQCCSRPEASDRSIVKRRIPALLLEMAWRWPSAAARISATWSSCNSIPPRWR